MKKHDLCGEIMVIMRTSDENIKCLAIQVSFFFRDASPFGIFSFHAQSFYRASASSKSLGILLQCTVQKKNRD